MRHNKRILIAVDNSDPSQRAVQYVADLIGGRADFHVGLLHLQLPPRVLEWGGSENPEIEKRLSSERAETYRKIEKKAIVEDNAFLQHYRALLGEKGIDETILLVQSKEPLARNSIANYVLKTAEERNFGTVVVGRHMFSFWESFFQHHAGEQWVRTGEGVAIWVVS